MNDLNKEKQEITKILDWAKWLLLVGVLIIVVMPFVLTRSSWTSALNFTQTGQIGDTIGGITAPFMSLIGAALVFLALRAQVKANELLQIQIDRENDEREDQIETQNLDQLYSYLETSINSFQYTGLRSGIIGINEVREEKLTGGDAFYKLFDTIKCEYHGSQEDLHSTQPVSELLSILKVMELLLNKLLQSTSKNKEILVTLTEHQFNYKILTRIRNEEEPDMRMRYCDACKREHGIPDELRYLIVVIRNLLSELKRQLHSDLQEKNDQ